MSRRLHEPPSRTVAEIRRPATGDRIRIRLLGQHLNHIDVRVFDTTRVSKGEPRPTTAGLTIRLDQADAVIEALEAAKREGGR